MPITTETYEQEKHRTGKSTVFFDSGAVPKTTTTTADGEVAGFIDYAIQTSDKDGDLNLVRMEGNGSLVDWTLFSKAKINNPVTFLTETITTGNILTPNPIGKEIKGVKMNSAANFNSNIKLYKNPVLVAFGEELFDPVRLNTLGGGAHYRQVLLDCAFHLDANSVYLIRFTNAAARDSNYQISFEIFAK